MHGSSGKGKASPPPATTTEARRSDPPDAWTSDAPRPISLGSANPPGEAQARPGSVCSRLDLYRLPPKVPSEWREGTETRRLRPVLRQNCVEFGQRLRCVWGVVVPRQSLSASSAYRSRRRSDCGRKAARREDSSWQSGLVGKDWLSEAGFYTACRSYWWCRPPISWLALRPLRGKPLDAVSRESQVPAHELESWKRVFLEHGSRA